MGGGETPPLPGLPCLGAGPCTATASKPPSLGWRLGKLTDVCCKYVHCNTGTGPDRYNQPLSPACEPCVDQAEREGQGAECIGVFSDNFSQIDILPLTPRTKQGRNMRL